MAKTEQNFLAENGKQQQRRGRQKTRVSQGHREIMSQRDEAGTSSNNNQQSPKRDQEHEVHQREEVETMSTDSDRTVVVPAINFERHLGATSVRYDI